jgi:hypothetical protein
MKVKTGLIVGSPEWWHAERLHLVLDSLEAFLETDDVVALECAQDLLAISPSLRLIQGGKR